MLAGRADELKDFNVGLAVFGRAPDFDPPSIPSFESRREAPPAPETVLRNRGLGRLAADRIAEGRIFSTDSRQGRCPRVEPVGEQAAETSPKQTGVLVTPFADFRPGHDHSNLCHGLREELINAPIRIPVLRVYAQTATAAPREGEIFAMGEELGVDYISDWEHPGGRVADSRQRSTGSPPG